MKGATGCAALFAAAATASAGVVPIGDPMDGNSWSQRFAEFGVGHFDFIGVRMVSDAPDAFKSTVFLNFGGALTTGWADAGINQPLLPRAGGASGPSVNATTVSHFQFDIHFDGAKSDPLEFHFAAFNGDAFAELASAKWSGSGWTFTPLNPNTYDWDREDFENAIVPLPTACAFAGVGVLGLGVRRQRVAL